MFNVEQFTRDTVLTIKKARKEVKKQQIDDLIARGVITKEQAADEYVRIAVEFSDAVDSILELGLSSKSDKQ